MNRRSSMNRTVSLASLDCSAAEYDQGSVAEASDDENHYNDSSSSFGAQRLDALPDLPFPLCMPDHHPKAEDDLHNENLDNEENNANQRHSSSTPRRAYLWNKLKEKSSRKLSTGSERSRRSSNSSSTQSNSNNSNSRRSIPERVGSFQLHTPHAGTTDDTNPVGYEPLGGKTPSLLQREESGRWLGPSSDTPENSSSEKKQSSNAKTAPEEVLDATETPTETEPETLTEEEEARVVQTAPDECQGSPPIEPSSLALVREHDNQQGRWSLGEESIDFDAEFSQQAMAAAKVWNHEDDSSISSSFLLESFVLQEQPSPANENQGILASQATPLQSVVLPEAETPSVPVADGDKTDETESDHQELLQDPRQPKRKPKKSSRRKKKKAPPPPPAQVHGLGKLSPMVYEPREKGNARLGSEEGSGSHSTPNTESTQSLSRSGSFEFVMSDHSPVPPPHRSHNGTRSAPVTPLRNARRRSQSPDVELRGLLQRVRSGEREAFEQLFVALKKEEESIEEESAHSSSDALVVEPIPPRASFRKSQSFRNKKSPKKGRRHTPRRMSLQSPSKSGSSKSSSPKRKQKVRRRRASMEHEVPPPPLQEEEDVAEPVDSGSEQVLNMQRRMAKLQRKLRHVQEALQEQEETSQKVQNLQATVDEQHALLERQSSHVDSLKEKIAIMQGRLGKVEHSQASRAPVRGLDRQPSAPTRRNSGSLISIDRTNSLEMQPPRRRKARRASESNSNSAVTHLAPSASPMTHATPRRVPKLLGTDDEASSDYSDGESLLPAGRRRNTKEQALEIPPSPAKSLLVQQQEEEDQLQMSWQADEDESGEMALDELQNSSHV